MIINWKGDRVLSVPVLEPRTEEAAEEARRKNMAVGAIKTHGILPGFNDVPDSIWPKVSGSLERYVEKGTLELFGKRESVEDDEGNSDTIYMGVPLKKLSPAKARTAVNGCFNLKTLSLWLDGDGGEYEGETRDETRLLIKTQIDKINAGTAEAVGAMK